MKKLALLMFSCVLCISSLGALAETTEGKSPDAASPSAAKSGAEAPGMSEIPKMKEQGQRMASLMQQLEKETDPAVRKRILAEAMCPQ